MTDVPSKDDVTSAVTRAASNTSLDKKHPRIGQNPDYDLGYETGYRDGESSGYADWLSALDEWPEYSRGGEIADAIEDLLKRMDSDARTEAEQLREENTVLHAAIDVIRAILHMAKGNTIRVDLPVPFSDIMTILQGRKDT